ncbi:unnamed protein product [Rhodiola kirilowii]
MADLCGNSGNLKAIAQQTIQQQEHQRPELPPDSSSATPT